MIFKSDLHIHTCLSPCGSLDMSPLDIVKIARDNGLNLIAISDHNSALNCPALKKVCEQYDDISCLFGIEVTSVEEVHNLTLFDDLEAVLDFGSFLYERLDTIPNNPEAFGDQVYVNEKNEIIGEVDKYLAGATSLSVEELLVEVHNRGGLFIPAHVDRASYSLTSQLGFIPDNPYDALEFSKFYYRDQAVGSNNQSVINSGDYPHITNSDSHYPDTVGMVYTEFDIEFPSINCIRDALKNGRFNICTPWHKKFA
ncbi:MAG: PHP domain-containing protein [Spirochaetes bacterium]|nr:PHP domain-containing protein [Spirochaetota bacterium]MBN2772584.1 PHP domain-containing protein [Spirochaetota bacterium]